MMAWNWPKLMKPLLISLHVLVNISLSIYYYCYISLLHQEEHDARKDERLMSSCVAPYREGR